MTSQQDVSDLAWASDAEIKKAIVSLDEASLLKLGRKAEILSLGLASEIGPEDLLQQAMFKTLSGERHWKKDIPFWLHLSGVMRSEASHVHEARRRQGRLAEAEPFDEESHLDSRSEERDRIAVNLMAKLEASLDDDELGLGVLMALQEGYKGPEVETILGCTHQEFEAAKKRIRLRLRRLDP